MPLRGDTRKRLLSILSVVPRPQAALNHALPMGLAYSCLLTAGPPPTRLLLRCAWTHSGPKRAYGRWGLRTDRRGNGRAGARRSPSSRGPFPALSRPLAFLSGCTECRRPGFRKSAATPVRYLEHRGVQVCGPSSPGQHPAGSLSPWQAVLCRCGSLGVGVLCPPRPGAVGFV